jgi:glycosyltransferase involved in cell wall biosynthesis
VLEGMSRGAVSLVHESCATSEISAGAGFYINTLSINDFADKLQFLIRHEELVKNMRFKAYEKSKQYDWKFSVEKLVSIYNAYE